MAYYNLFVIDYILIWKKKDYNFQNELGAVAQLGERIPCTDEVAGSIPVSSTIISPIAQLVERLTVNQFVAGSSPARGATAPSSSFGLGHRPVTAKTWVQIPLGPPLKETIP